MQTSRMGDLDELAARTLEELLDEVEERGHPAWVLFEEGADGRVARRVLPGAPAPYEIVISDACLAVGIVATGRVVPLYERAPVDHTVADPSDAEIQPWVGLAYVADRVGRGGWRSTLADDARGPLPAPEEGVIVDSVRRIMGLPTPPPPCPMESLHVFQWLERITTTSQAEGAPLSLAAAVSLVPEPFDDDWDDMRLEAAFGQGCWRDLISSEEAMWMDEGMFARYVLGMLAPEAEEAWADALPYLEPAAASVLETFLPSF